MSRIRHGLMPRVRRRASRPGVEALERRLALDGSATVYTWTALGDGTSFDDPSNWSHVGSYAGGVGVTGVPSPGSSLVFPPFGLLPEDSPTTVNFNGGYGSYPFASIAIDGSYTFDGNGIAVSGGISVNNGAFETPTDATILLASLSLGATLATPATISAQPGTTLSIGSSTSPTSVQLTIQGGLNFVGGGQLDIDAESVTDPEYGLSLQTFSVAGGTVVLGASMDFSGTRFQVGAGSSLDIGDDDAVKAGSLSGSGSVDLEGTGASGDTTALTLSTPAGESDQLTGTIDGDGQLTQQGDGSLTLGRIDLGPTSTIGVVLGTLVVDGPIAAGSLDVQDGTFGGFGTWDFAGPVTFQAGSTFDLALDGLAAGTESTQLISDGEITLGNGLLSGTVDYEYQAGDSFTIATGTQVQGVFQDVVDGQVLLGGNVPFAVAYSGTSVTLTALQSETTTRLGRSGGPSHPGQAVAFTATVGTRTMPVTSGTVSFEVGGAVVATEPLGPGGTATFTTTSLPLGGSTVTAVYSGAGSDLGSTSATVTQLVVPYSTVTTVASSINPSRVGQSVTLTATVTADGMPVTSGTVTFVRGNQRLGTAGLGPDGTATLTVSGLPKGSVRIQASYGGTPDDYGSVSPAFVQAVARYGTVTTITATTQAGANGKVREVLMAVVAADGVTPTGVVVFKRDGRTIGRARLSGGTAALVLPRRVPPRGRFVASFRRDGTFAASASSPLVLTG